MKMFFNMKEREVVQAYNGKQGCQCGCLGNYVKCDGPAMTRRVNKIKNFVGPMRPDAANFGDDASYSTEPFMGRNYVYVNEGDRTTCVYFKA